MKQKALCSKYTVSPIPIAIPIPIAMTLKDHPFPFNPPADTYAVKAAIGGREDGRRLEESLMRLYLADARRIALHPIVFGANGTSGLRGLHGWRGAARDPFGSCSESSRDLREFCPESP